MFRHQLCLILSCIFLFNLSGYGQSDLSKLFKQLNQLNQPTQVQFIHTGVSLETQAGDLARLNSSNNVFFKGKDLWVGINGTGKVYQIDSSMTITRLDKTEYGGSSFGSADFILNDTLFSIGGYGFWNTNGAIRYFNQITKEWDIIKSNISIPFANGINAKSYFDPLEQKFHLVYSKYNPEYIAINLEKTTFCYYQCLDLKTKKWLEEPLVIHSKLTSTFSDLTFIQTLPDGVIVNSKYFSSTLFFKFRDNKAYKLRDSKYTEIIQLKNKVRNLALLSTDSAFYLYDLANDSLNQFSITQSDLTELPFPLYISNQNYQFKWMDILLIPLIVISIFFGMLFFTYYKKYKKSKQLERNDKVYTIESDKKTINNFIQNLTEIERQLLELLVRNNWNSINTSVNQINKILGTEKKDVKVQNNIRGEIINQINDKFSMYSSIIDKLIERQRVEFDKRYVEYFINEKLLLKFPKKIFD